ncbi:LEAF RUST 10 DISEASE-RESISTANCE LOCUS RECEPTOR-LIKE PROTEIN KINASE-like 2.7 isoform X2 [Durio zibethinus]|uniref:non-specific serine/threonine protein kinase n=1 Tax=Durio zibethinus TaxID=66656 RepID=A0A6P6A3D1_DURZI|nr:LEAF RUST 10 DISEASE-RESISTANCE LOCUS RECEPTOR-LIKE PROTEIN KINASE-like 2.7 isoform X2 [Durio zibethinus]
MHPPLLPSKFWFFMIISLILILTAQPVFANDGNISSCSARFSCGDIQNIGYPFWGLDRPESCGYPGFRLNCNQNTPEITINSATYQVRYISNFQVLEVARADYSGSICPTSLVNSTFTNSPFEINIDALDITLYYGCHPLTVPGLQDLQWISSQFNCTINSTDVIGYYVTRNITQTSLGSVATLVSTSLGSCNNSVIIPVLNSQVQLLEANRNSDTLLEALTAGFELHWSANDTFCNRCLNSGGQCGYNLTLGGFLCYCSNGSYLAVCSSSSPGLTGAAASIIGLICTIYFIIYRNKGESASNEISWTVWQRKVKHKERIDAFIRKHCSLAPLRYSHSDIKKITDKFVDKLGQGGYGSVYKGKLSNGRFVAVQVLSESKGNGEEFMNEVASISRTSHVNIVSLLGFCYEKSKRALIYEFMPNGSLDKFIYCQGSDQRRQLEWKTLFDIALGIARGLEYLHQGCNTRILHFDIKPHNILLDESFGPKISDFGLSKLCERKESMVSMAEARGTIGYIAPEVFCRNFGVVSHKSDVYSYGMMVLEMVGGRKNVDVGVAQTSEIYFPSWIYKHLDQAMDLNLHGVTDEEEEEITRKLIVVSLWCIQSDPSDRPSMTKVLEMLQGSLHSLEIPPRPFVSSPVRSPKSDSTT